jgi:hypothetical protein
MLSVEILKFVILLIFFIWITLLSCFELYYKISTKNTDLLHTFEKININNKVILSHLTKNQSIQEILYKRFYSLRNRIRNRVIYYQ